MSIRPTLYRLRVTAGICNYNSPGMPFLAPGWMSTYKHVIFIFPTISFPYETTYLQGFSAFHTIFIWS